MTEHRVEKAVESAVYLLRNAKDSAVTNADYPAAAQLRDLIDALKEACQEHNRQGFYEAVGV